MATNIISKVHLLHGSVDWGSDKNCCSGNKTLSEIVLRGGDTLDYTLRRINVEIRELCSFLLQFWRVYDHILLQLKLSFRLLPNFAFFVPRELLNEIMGGLKV